MYAMYGILMTQPGNRAQFAEILMRAAEIVGQLPGCRLYVVHEDPRDETTLTVYEAWDDKTAHDASLQDERVRALIAEALPLMGGPPAGVELRVVGGHGLGDK